MSPNEQTCHAPILWGTPHSLYTGKLRSYLIKKGLAFRECFPSHPRFQSAVVPAVRLVVVPVLEIEPDQFLQDSNDIIAELERRFPASPMVPDTPLQHAVARLLDAFGSEALLAPAMHYRWSYLDEQRHFLCAEFGRALHVGPEREARLQAGAQFMDYFSGWLPALGVTPASIPLIEQAHEELLDLLDIHFQHHPYLLGGHPCIADFGFMAPLFAHLGRDPVPAALMMKRAPNVYRWTERMNRAQIADGEFPDHPQSWLPDDAIAPTLEPILKLMFQDWGPQLQAEAALLNGWLADNPNLPAGHLLSHDGSRSVHPTLGAVDFDWRGIGLQRASMPYSLWRFVQASGAAAALDGAARLRFDDLVERLGGGAAMALRLARPLLRQDHVLVLGERP
jgi:glutathione S-transferase